jgi:hypothetical protein
MPLNKLLFVLLLSCLSLSTAQAVGEPINEDFSSLIAISGKMVAAGKQADVTGFESAADEASSTVKEQGMKGNSPTLQRLAPKFKAAKKAAKNGDFEQANKYVEEALTLMKK